MAFLLDEINDRTPDLCRVIRLFRREALRLSENERADQPIDRGVGEPQLVAVPSGPSIRPLPALADGGWGARFSARASSESG